MERLGCNKTLLKSSQIQQLSLDDICKVTSTLTSVLSASIGPKGQGTLLQSNTGQVLMVRDGFQTLSCLHLEHPVAKLILQSAQRLNVGCGDGCKTMIILLDAIFLNFERDINSQALYLNSGSFSRRNRICKSLRMFLATDFPNLISSTKDFVYVRMLKAIGDRGYQWILRLVILTYLSGCIPSLAVSTIADSMVQFFAGNHNDMISNFKESIQWFYSSIFVVPNKPYSDSHVESGFFIQRPIISQHSDTILSVNAICMLCSFGGEAFSNDKYVCLLNNPEKLINHRHTVAKDYVSMLYARNVSLVISSLKLPTYVVDMCHRLGLAVIDCVDEQDIELICCITNKSPVASLSDEIESRNMIKVSSCTQIVDGSHIYSKLVFDDELRWNPRALFLCAPTENLGKQLKNSLVKSTALLRHLLEENSSSSHINANGDSESKAYCSILNNVVCGGGFFEIVLCQYLDEYMRDVSKPPDRIHCASVIKEMVIALPQALHSCLLGESRRKTNWLRVLDSLRDGVKQGYVCRLNSRGLVDCSQDLDVLEVMSVKITVLYSVISVAVSLLNLEDVIKVQSIPAL